MYIQPSCSRSSCYSNIKLVAWKILVQRFLSHGNNLDTANKKHNTNWKRVLQGFPRNHTYLKDELCIYLLLCTLYCKRCKKKKMLTGNVWGFVGMNKTNIQLHVSLYNISLDLSVWKCISLAVPFRLLYCIYYHVHVYYYMKVCLYIYGWFKMDEWTHNWTVQKSAHVWTMFANLAWINPKQRNVKVVWKFRCPAFPAS